MWRSRIWRAWWLVPFVGIFVLAIVFSPSLEERERNMRVIGRAYFEYMDSHDGQAPSGPDDLSPLLADSPGAAGSLRGKVYVNWGVTRHDLERVGRPAGRILAYESDGDGGFSGVVLMGDGRVSWMAEREFNRTPQAAHWADCVPAP
jgi:hypothetical protein